MTEISTKIPKPRGCFKMVIRFQKSKSETKKSEYPRSENCHGVIECSIEYTAVLIVMRECAVEESNNLLQLMEIVRCGRERGAASSLLGFASSVFHHS